jgi:hypothetical protein
MVEVRAMRNPICEVKIDRVTISASHPTSATPPAFYGYRIVGDKFIRRQGRVKTYLRGREYRNSETGTRIYLCYQPVLPALSQFRLTLIANDRRLLCYAEINEVVREFATYMLTLIEVAFDFQPASHVDVDYVRQHAIFGKSRPSGSRRYVGKLRYGGRLSDKLVRCYQKEPFDYFRVELELHAALLRRFGIDRLEDLKKLPHSLHPSHIRFVRVDWHAVGKHLSGRAVSGRRGGQLGVAPTAAIHKILAFLRQRAGVKNVHRLLVPLRINIRILRALKDWARNFRK